MGESRLRTARGAAGFAGLLRFELGGLGQETGGVGPGTVELAILVEPIRGVDPRPAELRRELLGVERNGPRSSGPEGAASVFRA